MGPKKYNYGQIFTTLWNELPGSREAFYKFAMKKYVI